MRQKFPEGSGGPFEVPGVGRVIGGEEFDYPDPISACVPVEDAADGAGEAADSAVGPGAGEDKSGDGEDSGAEAQSRPRVKGARP